MKAIVLNNTGPAKDINKNLVIKELPIPEIKENEVLINVKAASLNHRDLWITKGMYPGIKLPLIPGSDCSGIVHAAGSKVTLIKAGDEVLVNPGFNWGTNEDYQSREFTILGMPEDGTLAEYIKVNAGNVYKKPEHLSFPEASAIPLAGVTAFRGLFKKAEIKKDDNILITGIGGGAASMAFVFALKTGANIFVTSSDDLKIKKAIELGAVDGVNYSNESWTEELKEKSKNKIDIIFDGAGGTGYSKYIEICSYGGKIISYGASHGNSDSISLHKVYWKQLKICGTTMGSQTDFSEMIKYVSEKRIRPVIDKEFRFTGIHKAFIRMNDSLQFGKIIITP